MAGSYEFWLTDDYGRRLATANGATLLDRILSGTFQRVANGAGRLSARFPASFDTKLLSPDYMLQVWRAPEGGRLALWRTYFLRRWRLARVGSELLIDLAGLDANDLLRRRIVANYAQTTGSEKRNYADGMMKAVVNDQMIADNSDPASAYGSRTVPGLSYQLDVGAGPLLSKAFAWQQVDQVVADLQRASWGAGTEVFWDVAEDTVTPTSISFQFRTRIDQPGADRTETAIFDEARGNLEAAELTYDWTEETNYIYCPGQGEDRFRYVAQAYDTARIAVSRYGRCEGIAYGSYSSSPEEAEAAAYEALMAGRPQRIFRGQASDTAGTVFGRDWNWGDRVTARFLGNEFEAIIRQVILSIDGSGKETIDARIESVDWNL